MNTYIIGDIHGEVDKLKNCLQAVNFNYNEDRLITLGDICDRGMYTFECIEELLKIKHRVDIQGNHDYCFWDTLKSGNYNPLFNQGGKASLLSYIRNCKPETQIVEKLSGYYSDFTINDMPETHKNFFANQLPFYIEDNDCFVHGGFNRHYSIFEQPDDVVFIWDRDLFAQAFSWEQRVTKEHPFKYKDKFRNVFIGHSPTTDWGYKTPMKCANIYNLDTGCGKNKEAKLTIMNLSTKEYFQS